MLRPFVTEMRCFFIAFSAVLWFDFQIGLQPRTGPRETTKLILLRQLRPGVDAINIRTHTCFSLDNSSERKTLLRTFITLTLGVNANPICIFR